MVLHNSHVVEFLQRFRDWYDVTLEADHWDAMSDIAPCNALK